jgi:hypothetical protein
MDNTTSAQTLTAPWIIATQDFTEYSCEDCAREWATKNGIPATKDSGYERELDGYGVVETAYAVWPYAECDYPPACGCGQYLDAQLTEDGLDYLVEHELPEWVVKAYTD